LPGTPVRSTIYLEAAVQQALRVKAAVERRSMSEIVNDALRSALRDDEEDLAAFAKRDRELSISYEALLAQLKGDLRQYLREAIGAGRPEDSVGDIEATTALTARADSVLAELWDNPRDAQYESMSGRPRPTRTR
jgi:plasmid stability protein